MDQTSRKDLGLSSKEMNKIVVVIINIEDMTSHHKSRVKKEEEDRKRAQELSS